MNPHESKLFELLPTITFLKQTEFFRGVPTNYLASLAELAEAKTFAPGEVIEREGDKALALMVICEGRAGVTMEGKYLWDVEAPNCIGEISLLDGEPEPMTVTAKDSVRALSVSLEDFDDLLSSQPQFARAIMRKMAWRLREFAKSAFLNKASAFAPVHW